MEKCNQVVNKNDSQNYLRTEMQREIVIDRLKERGCRITKQRLMKIAHAVKKYIIRHQR